MSETYTTGGGRSDYRLPTVSTSDNGKVLKVVEGEWNKADESGGGGGGGDSTIIFLPVTRSDSTYAIDLDSETIAEDKELILDGTKPVLLVDNSGANIFRYPDVYYANHQVYQFKGFNAGATVLYLLVDTMTVTDDWD